MVASPELWKLSPSLGGARKGYKMRPILFKAKEKGTGIWVSGFYAKESNHACLPNEIKTTHFIFRDEFLDWNIGGLREYEIIPETVCQFTGEHDKNGKPIFENDIVLMNAYGKGKHKARVYFDGGKFAVDGSRYHFKDLAARSYEVIGNVFDSNELVKEFE